LVNLVPPFAVVCPDISFLHWNKLISSLPHTSQVYSPAAIASFVIIPC
jgi:hypothetical protein